MADYAYTPGVGNAPFGELNSNAFGSEYAANSGYTTTSQETILLQLAVRKAIFDAAPEQYNALKLVFEKEMIEYGATEFRYEENTFGRSALQATANVGAVAAVPGASVQQTIAMTAASVTYITPDVIIIYPDNTQAVVKSIVGLNVLVESQTSSGLSAVTTNDIFSILSVIQADAMDYFSNYERLGTIDRYNYIQQFLRADRWGRVELLEWQNQGTTDYLVRNKAEKMRQIRTDLFNAFFNGIRGEYRISNNYITKAMGGIFPTLQAAGSMNANPTLAGLIPTFQTLAFKTNYKKVGATRFIYGTDEMIFELMNSYKGPQTRYAPNDSIANLNLNQIEFGTMKFVPVVCELFREQSCFPKDWARRLLVIDQEAISPVKMKGLPAFFSGETLNRGERGTRESFTDFYIEANLSMQMNNPLSSFWIDVQ